MSEYNTIKAIQRIENELIESMIRNFDRHRAEEKEAGYDWTAWQAEQLKALEQYKRRNMKEYQGRFGKLNSDIESMIRLMRQTGRASQEIGILEALKKGYQIGKEIQKASIEGRFFKVNDRKLNALIKATMDDMKKAEQAVLRMANDKYRKVIFDAQVYANTGAGTYEKAVDMATKDMLSAGLNCVEYANGARHTLANYARMAIKTANKRAYLMGEGEMRAEWGVHTVIVKKRGNACPLCLPFVGKVMIDDVYSGGSKADGNYPLLSQAMAAGYLHPNCKDIHTTYFPGISTPPEGANKEDVEKAKEDYTNEQKQNYCAKNAERFRRMSENSLDPDNKRKYGARAQEWEEKEKHYQKSVGEDSREYRISTGKSNEEYNSKKIELGEISLDNIEDALEYFEDNIRLQTVENAIVIDKKGKVTQFIGTHESVSIFDVDLQGAYITHNHPVSEGIVSFGQNDFMFLRDNQHINFRCVNKQYNYNVKVLKPIDDLSYNLYYNKAMANYLPGEDMQHLVFEELRKDGYVHYERKKVDKSSSG